jgi:selenocysteine-specific elongation factor
VDAERSRRLLQSLLREKALIRVSPELVFHSSAIAALLETLRGSKKAGESIRVPEFKELAGISRKYAIPLLEYLDRSKVTRRIGDDRVLL